jgi:hypothetical protein
MRFIYFPLIFLFIFNSCAYKKSSHNFVANKIKTPVFISMPENVLTFDNISPLVYKTMWKYFRRVGYVLTDNEGEAFTFKVKIKNLRPENKFISPDILLYNIRIKIELLCSVFDKDKKLLAQKTFSFYKLISKPRNSILNSDFMDFEYRKLLERAAPKVEQYFRKYFLV